LAKSVRFLNRRERRERKGGMARDSWDFMPRQTGIPKRDTLTAQSAHLSADGLTLTLDIPDLRKSHQLQINLKLRPADGRNLNRVIYITAPVLAGPQYYLSCSVPRKLGEW